jgi:hypothetical protein
MKDFACDIINNKVLAKNSNVPLGKVLDLYFDEISWNVRGIMAIIGSWLRGKTVVIPVTHARRASGELLWLPLTKNEIERSSSASMQRSVDTRRVEENPTFFIASNFSTFEGFPRFIPYTPFVDLNGSRAKKKAQLSTLRSVREIMTYHFSCGGSIRGRVRDFLINDSSWKVEAISLVPESPVGMKRPAIVPVTNVRSVNWENSSVTIKATKEKFRTWLIEN